MVRGCCAPYWYSDATPTSTHTMPLTVDRSSRPEAMLKPLLITLVVTTLRGSVDGPDSGPACRIQTKIQAYYVQMGRQSPPAGKAEGRGDTCRGQGRHLA